MSRLHVYKGFTRARFPSLAVITITNALDPGRPLRGQEQSGLFKLCAKISNKLL